MGQLLPAAVGQRIKVEVGGIKVEQGQVEDADEDEDPRRGRGILADARVGIPLDRKSVV